MIKNLLLSAMVMLLSVFAVAQSGALQGKVTDSKTKQPIPFANVSVERGGKFIGGASTDFDGNYKIKPLDPGKYNVKVTNVGYTTSLTNGVVINSDKIRSLNIKIASSTEEIVGVTITEYKIPLINADETSSGETMTGDQIAKMPGRSASAVAVTVGGVFSDDNGAMGGMRGQRSGGTATFIDGVRVIGNSNLPQSAIEQVSVITGGTPAQYGDLTGGVINITTKGPSRNFGFGVEGVTSELIDGYGYSLLGFSVNGPLIMGKDSTKSTSLLGFFLSGEANYNRDGSPASIGTYQVNDEKLTYLRENPLYQSPTGSGVFPSSNYVTKESFDHNDVRTNAETISANFQGKFDVRTTDNTTLTFGGSYSYGQGTIWSAANTLFNYNNNGEYTSDTWRVYGKFTHRFPTAKDSKALIKNVYYTIQADYSSSSSHTYSAKHGDDLFDYGYVGKFDTYRVKSYELGDDTVAGLTDVYIMNGYSDTLYDFTRSEINSDLSNYTDQYYGFYEGNDFYRNSLTVQNGGALLNGQTPESVYGLYNNTGTPYNGNSTSETSRIGFNANGAADVGNHEIKFGIQYEQRKTQAVSYNPAGLWTLMRGLTNSHIEQLDYSNPYIFQQDGYIHVDYDRLYDANNQAFFDQQLRTKLGLPVNGLDYIDLDSYDPETFSLDMFSTDELLNSGNPYVSYYGYDVYGNKLSSKPSFEDFFTELDENGNSTRAIGAYEPIYMAGYIQDKFAYNDLILSLGLRFDRFDANQKVLKDPYLLSEAKTVKEVDNLGEIPSNMGDDYVVYVNDIANPTAIVGYRDGSNWYNASGTQIDDPSVLETAAGIAPYLQDADNTELKASAFEDYTPQNTISPRISFSFPISEDALFFAHYDVLTSRPTSGNRIPLMNYYFISQVGTSIINNPDLKPERTTDYELGFQQVLSKSSSLKFSVYYREMRDQIQAYRYSSAYPVSYISYNNIDFGTVKGGTIAYDLRRTKNLWMKVSYTLQFANATGSSTQSTLSLIQAGQANLRTLSPTSQDRNHTINITADYRYGKGINYDGPSIKRRVKGTNKVKVYRLLENTGANISMQAGSGTPYSRQSNVTSALLGGVSPILQGSINGSRLPWQYRFDLRIDRDIFLERKEGSSKRPHYLNVYVQVLNLLDSRNVMGVYRYTGNPDDDGYLTSADYQSTIEAKESPQAYRDMYGISVNNAYNYSMPRRIRLGVLFNF